MKRYSKKIALILVLALTLAIAIPVLAAETKITGRYKIIPLAVTLPGNTDAIVNPYGLPLAFTTDDGTEIGTLKDSQVVTAIPLVGFSSCEVDLDIGATVVGTPQGSFRLATEKPANDATTKSGLVYFEMKTVSDLAYTTTPDASTHIGNLGATDILTALNGWAKTTYRESDKTQAVVKATPVTKNAMCTLKAATKQADGSMMPSNDGYFVARLSGDIVKAPRDPWVAEDGIDVTITWVIAPHEETT